MPRDRSASLLNPKRARTDKIVNSRYQVRMMFPDLYAWCARTPAETKTAHVLRCLLELHGDRMEYVRLLKLLYIADREMMAEAGAPVTGDRAVAMDHGPVLSHV
jgi:hypothetical protein